MRLRVYCSTAKEMDEKSVQLEVASKQENKDNVNQNCNRRSLIVIN